MSLREELDYTAVLLVLSGLLFCVPLLDMWQDVYVGGKSPGSTLLENSIILLISSTFVGLSVWLVRNDWERAYAQLVARWSIFGTVCVAVAYGWVLGTQLLFQNDLKPYIIAADGVVIGGVVLFVAGVYNARSRRESTAREIERDRFSALFDNTSDAMVAVESTHDGTVITAVNEPFARRFGDDDSTFVGQSAATVVSDRLLTADEPAPERQVQTVIEAPDEQAQLRLSTADGERDYLLGYVPIGDGLDQHDDTEGFLLFTDITPQKERERQFERLSEGAKGLLDARSAEGVAAATRTLAADLFDTLLVGVWSYDPESDAYQPLVSTVGETGGGRLEEIQPVPAGETDGAQSGVEFDQEGPAFDPAALDEALTLPEFDSRETTVRRLPGPYRLTLTRLGPEISKPDQHLIDLLVANTRAAMRRVEREQELARRNDQLEFVNSLLRHDIQNSMTVIRARGQALSESLSNQEAEYARTIVDQSDQVIDLVGQFRVLLDALTDVGGEATKPVELSSVLEHRVDTLKTTHSEATVTVEIAGETTIRADDMLGNVLGNVLTNAAEHSESQEPTIEVSVLERDQTVAVRIADDGPGVPDEQKETIFRRGNRGLKESDIGSGFGLFFVDTMMEKYGGDVRVLDNDPRGAIFELMFQKAQ